MNSHGLRGFVGQGMDARKTAGRPTLLAIKDTTSSTDSYTATTGCIALIYAWGAGGSGSLDGSQASGGGGGAAGYKRLRMTAGQVLSWSVGAGAAAPTTVGIDGGDTTVTLPGGLVLTAGGGKGGADGAVAGGAGGVASGSWDVARNGGAGGPGGGSATAGGSPTGGGTGGAASGNYGGGGGSAGFTDKVSGLPTGNGGAGNAGSDEATAPGGASGGGSVGQPGKNGRVLVYILSVST